MRSRGVGQGRALDMLCSLGRRGACALDVHREGAVLSRDGGEAEG